MAEGIRRAGRQPRRRAAESPTRSAVPPLVALSGAGSRAGSRPRNRCCRSRVRPRRQPEPAQRRHAREALEMHGTKPAPSRGRPVSRRISGAAGAGVRRSRFRARPQRRLVPRSSWRLRVRAPCESDGRPRRTDTVWPRLAISGPVFPRQQAARSVLAAPGGSRLYPRESDARDPHAARSKARPDAAGARCGFCASARRRRTHLESGGLGVQAYATSVDRAFGERSRSAAVRGKDRESIHRGDGPIGAASHFKVPRLGVPGPSRGQSALLRVRRSKRRRGARCGVWGTHRGCTPSGAITVRVS